MEEGEKRGHLKSGLLPRYKRSIAGFLPCPLNTMWAKLIAIETDYKQWSNDKKFKEKDKVKDKTSEKEKEKGPTKLEPNKQKDKNGTSEKGPKNGAEKKPFKWLPIEVITCYNCDKKGHFGKNCTEPDRRKIAKN